MAFLVQRSKVFPQFSQKYTLRSVSGFPIAAVRHHDHKQLKLPGGLLPTVERRQGGTEAEATGSAAYWLALH